MPNVWIDSFKAVKERQFEEEHKLTSKQMFDTKTMNHTDKSLYLLGHSNELLQSNSFELRGEALNIADVFFLSENTSVPVGIDDAVCDMLKENRNYLMALVEKGMTIYGVNTGFGGSADVRSSDTDAMQRALLRLLNAGVGPCFDSKIVRAAMAIRTNCLCRGYSGVRPELVLQIVKLLNNGITPKVPIRGSISASGDLMPLSYVAAAVAGRPDLNVDHKGELRTMEDIKHMCDIEPLTLQAKEGLAIMNSVSFSTAVSAMTTYHANIATLLTQACSALCFEAMHGKVDSLHPLIHRIKPHSGQIEVAENMRMLLEDSQMVSREKEFFQDHQCHSLAQDRYDLRTVPQWIGPVLECLSDVIGTINTELVSVDDNPIVDHRTGAILSGGNFQGTALMCGMDRLRSALQLCGKLLMAQLYELVNPAMNKGLTPNLSGQDIRTDFGFKGVDIAMAAYMSELEHLGNPVSNHVQSAEMNNQSVNSLALISGRLTSEAVEIVQTMISMHLCAVVQVRILTCSFCYPGVVCDNCGIIFSSSP